MNKYKEKEQECNQLLHDQTCRRQLYEMENDDIDLYNYLLEKDHNASVGFQKCEALTGLDSIFCNNQIRNQMNKDD